MNYKKYRKSNNINLVDREWPSKSIEKAPIWCSVDLRDGNQALVVPMNLEEKIRMFKNLVKIGFKQIEVGFPAASDTEFQFVRTLISENLIPDDVVIQVLTQSRDNIIERTFEALEGVKKAIVHFYNSTSILQRDVVFNMNKEEIKKIAVNGAKLVKNLSEKYEEGRFLFEYSPESFTGTELPYALEICNAVIDEIKPNKENKLIVNLPSTVEMATPNVYADQIEYMCRNLKNRENLIISVHAHNDRGTAVAASELAIMAGADRVEGTLFGNGERTGNMDIITMSMNLYSVGIDPKLDFSNIDDIISMYEEITSLPVSPRHPYAGMYVFTAFSGSHQDAINKGIKKIRETNSEIWEVPYIPIDPFDIGRNYDDLIRINSQSGKGGLDYILKENYELNISKTMQADFSKKITLISDSASKELSAEEIYESFKKEYVNIYEPIKLLKYEESINDKKIVTIEADILINNEKKSIIGEGDGFLHAFCKAIQKEIKIEFEINEYDEHSLQVGTKSQAITYIRLKNGHEVYGVGISSNITTSSLRAVTSAVNNMLRKK